MGLAIFLVKSTPMVDDDPRRFRGEVVVRAESTIDARAIAAKAVRGDLAEFLDERLYAVIEVNYGDGFLEGDREGLIAVLRSGSARSTAPKLDPTTPPAANSGCVREPLVPEKRETALKFHPKIVLLAFVFAAPLPLPAFGADPPQVGATFLVGGSDPTDGSAG
jgi:hypothetical protein